MGTMVLMRLTGFILVLACAGCGHSPTGPSAIDSGLWGGDHVTLMVGEGKAHFEFDCAHGDIPAALTADHGEIAASGTFVREHGGPIRVDEVQDAHPAVYSGSVSGARMQLSIRLTDSADVVGPFVLTRGASGRVVKCL
jgi:hypothetical protein